MTINPNNFSAGLGLAVLFMVGFGIGITIKESKRAEEARECFKAHKVDALTNGHVYDDVDTASIANESFDTDNRVKAKKLLMVQLEQVKRAKDIEEFDKELGILYDLIKSFTIGPADQQIAFLNYAWDEHLARQAQREREEASRQEDRRTDRIAKALENSARTIATVSRSASQIQNALPGHDFSISIGK